jgi:hypothetical protein
MFPGHQGDPGFSGDPNDADSRVITRGDAASQVIKVIQVSVVIEMMQIPGSLYACSQVIKVIQVSVVIQMMQIPGSSLKVMRVPRSSR